VDCYCERLSSALHSAYKIEESLVIVCVCNGIRERDVRHAARNGATTPCAAYTALGRRARCGQCSQFAREIIQSERHAA